MTDMRPATPAQKHYILKLAGCEYFSQVARVTRVGMTQRAKRGDLWRGEASDIIDDLLAQQGGGTEQEREFLAVEYRTWQDNHYSRSGRTPSTARYFAHGNADDRTLKEKMRESGHLAETLYQGSDEETARRTMLSHRGGYGLAGAHGHERLLKHLAPKGGIELLSDLAPEHLREAVKRKTTRTGWVFLALRLWMQNNALLDVTRTDTLAVLAALGDSMTSTTTGPEAQQIVDRAVETHALVGELLRQGHPSGWATKLARNKSGVELPEALADEIVRRMKSEAEQVSA
ncbi:hypothetical protein [Mycobacteroides abscessus]|uniref:hypothetical protein n=1 Tax=Mycobacteroides abscessus TaxID=36809 RepID=UPI0009285331|nr:hypothetical protein [Mycobacteroides abscessus]MBN7483780.1 hypothetical protein [Mycobacteroides abscessus subsp. massiliense]SHP20907.1 Uncharacterised protein [Mycobacteroides abscessus subsp. abscessus]SHP59026.1 Uncharacterised protein [Mycobacteroides abscessus subsp. abscessus]SHP59139.1 Uncharacterised protein [Mycobacteroides abscessus subsp. abscessus]SHP82978.1 Uncharacterised protein [Mycobacteroides abscessus subsp. abscessus]